MDNQGENTTVVQQPHDQQAPQQATPSFHTEETVWAEGKRPPTTKKRKILVGNTLSRQKIKPKKERRPKPRERAKPEAKPHFKETKVVARFWQECMGGRETCNEDDFFSKSDKLILPPRPTNHKTSRTQGRRRKRTTHFYCEARTMWERLNFERPKGWQPKTTKRQKTTHHSAKHTKERRTSVPTLTSKKQIERERNKNLASKNKGGHHSDGETETRGEKEGRKKQKLAHQGTHDGWVAQPSQARFTRPRNTLRSERTPYSSTRERTRNTTNLANSFTRRRSPRPMFRSSWANQAKNDSKAKIRRHPCILTTSSATKRSTKAGGHTLNHTRHNTRPK